MKPRRPSAGDFFNRLLMILAIGYAIGASLTEMRKEDGHKGNPRRPAPARGPETLALPDVQTAPGERALGIYQVETGPASGNAIGTAFALNGQGVWLTAKHVVENCRRVMLLNDRYGGIEAEHWVMHGAADLALIYSSKKGAPLALGGGRPASNSQAFHFGFPQNHPAAVESRYMGAYVMQKVGLHQSREPVYVWAETRRLPDFDGGLGGISGGPALTRDGRLIGVTVAGSLRRGRVMTAHPNAISGLIARSGVDLGDRPAGEPIDPARLAALEQRLRARGSVAEVYCMAESPTP